MKFLFDLFPIILFFAAYKFAGIFAATAVAIAATVGQIAWVWFRHRKVDTMLWVSLGLVTVMGGATIYFHSETFIKWKPSVLYWAMGLTFWLSPLLFGDAHPYGLPGDGLGNAASLGALGPAALKAAHAKWLRPDLARITVVGDITMAELKPLLDVVKDDGPDPKSGGVPADAVDDRPASEAEG